MKSQHRHFSAWIQCKKIWCALLARPKVKRHNAVRDAKFLEGNRNAKTVTRLRTVQDNIIGHGQGAGVSGMTTRSY
ncbi:hypothetical protein [Paraburkholderia strydomiana]|uniref:hypothetical protein n=1 Tax=Paraburkholderia strydomiana TaxID=1245417 RepID=UPI00333A1D1A